MSMLGTNNLLNIMHYAKYCDCLQSLTYYKEIVSKLKNGHMLLVFCAMTTLDVTGCKFPPGYIGGNQSG